MQSNLNISFFRCVQSASVVWTRVACQSQVDTQLVATTIHASEGKDSEANNKVVVLPV